MNSFTRFAQLWTDYLEGELDAAGLEELNALLSADSQLLEQATDSYQTHRLLGLWGSWQTGHEDPFVTQIIERIPEGNEQFTQTVMERVQREITSCPLDRSPEVMYPSRRNRLPSRRITGWLLALLCLLAFPLAVRWGWDQTSHPSPLAQQNTPQPVDTGSEVRFQNLAHATFFGQLNPRSQELLPLGKEYVLTSGLVELAFPQGAQAIIEGPAVFRVVSADCLSMDLGRCSVHAPEGAEGFRVETPVTQVVDRGTRFLIQVTETNETEVQVVEGMADIYRLEQQDPESEFTSSTSPSGQATQHKGLIARLEDRQARRILNEREFVAQPAPYDSNLYRKQLPDRLISYQAAAAGRETVDQLLSVTVQRGGQVLRYSAQELIPVEVISFRADSGIDKNGHILGGTDMEDLRSHALSDFSLSTGIINPGGNQQPLTEDPVVHSEVEFMSRNTPGMALQFEQPVKNGPGPDIVLFEVQPISGPGHDAFHVSPLKFTPNRKSHTIDRYDLSLTSPEAMKVPDFYLYPFEQTVSSLYELQSLPTQRRHIPLRFRAVAVGIDLSDLGFEPGETTEGIFLQDAGDDQNRIDPVFIGGLP